MSQDLVTLVDEQDQVIGSMDKIQAHRLPAQLHRAISVFLFRKNQGNLELLLQQRSPQKIVGAGQWANTACGNVWPGETYEQCARRRLKHELGITPVDLQPLTVFRYQVQCNEAFGENEIDQVFAGWYDGNVNSNPEEVSDYRWVRWDTLQQNFDPLTLELAPWFQLLLTDENVGRHLNRFISKTYLA